MAPQARRPRRPALTALPSPRRGEQQRTPASEIAAWTAPSICSWTFIFARHARNLQPSIDQTERHDIRSRRDREILLFVELVRHRRRSEGAVERKLPQWF